MCIAATIKKLYIPNFVVKHNYTSCRCREVKSFLNVFCIHYYDHFSMTKLVWGMRKLWRFYGHSIEPPYAAKNILERSNQEQTLKLFVTSNEKEKEQHEQNLQSYSETLANIAKAFREIGVVDDVDKQYENYVSGEFDGIVLPVIGRTDVESKRFLIELKTKWRTRGGLKKDGTRSFTKSRVPDKPDENHLKQLAFYHTFKPKVKSLLVYVCEREDHGYKIFDIEDYDYKSLMQEFKDDLEVKQNIAQLDDPRKYVKKDFKHWGWDIGEENFLEAKRYYGYQ